MGPSGAGISSPEDRAGRRLALIPVEYQKQVAKRAEKMQAIYDILDRVTG
jgi:hypothetical protein